MTNSIPISNFPANPMKVRTKQVVSMKLDNKEDNEAVINHELSSICITQNNSIRISQSNTSKSSKKSLATSIL